MGGVDTLVPLDRARRLVPVHPRGLCQHSCVDCPWPERETMKECSMTGRRNFLRSLTTTLAAPFAVQAQSRGGAPPLPAHSDPAYWNKIRDQFLLARDKVFFNNGTIGAMPRVVYERTAEHLRKMATDIA